MYILTNTTGIDNRISYEINKLGAGGKLKKIAGTTGIKAPDPQMKVQLLAFHKSFQPHVANSASVKGVFDGVNDAMEHQKKLTFQSIQFLEALKDSLNSLQKTKEAGQEASEDSVFAYYYLQDDEPNFEGDIMITIYNSEGDHLFILFLKGTDKKPPSDEEIKTFTQAIESTISELSKFDLKHILNLTGPKPAKE